MSVGWSEYEQYVQKTKEELEKVREPSTVELQVLKELLPGAILLRAEAKSLGVVVASNPESMAFNVAKYLRTHPKLRKFTPPSLTVAVDPTNLIIPGTLDQTFDRVAQMTLDYSRKIIEPVLPEARARMLFASSVMQLSLDYSSRPEAKNEPLFSRIKLPDTARYSGLPRVYALEITGYHTEDIYASDWGPYMATVGYNYERTPSPLNLNGHTIHEGRKEIGGLLAVVFMKN